MIQTVARFGLNLICITHDLQTVSASLIKFGSLASVPSSFTLVHKSRPVTHKSIITQEIDVVLNVGACNTLL